MRRLLLIGLAILLAASGVALWFVQDANRFKPALVAFIEAETGVPVQIRGDLGWRFKPRLWLAAEDLHALHEGRTWSLQRLVLRPDTASLIHSPAALENWRVAGLNIENLVMEDTRGVLQAPRLTLGNVGLGSLMPLAADLVYTPDGMAPMAVTLAGSMTLAADRVRVRELAFRAPHATGICNLEAMPNGKLWPPLQAQENDILPVAVMRAYDWDGHCEIERFVVGDETIEGVAVVLDNKEGGSIVTVDAPSFLGGEGQLETIVRADRSPVSWEIKPVFAGVESRRLAAWFGGTSLINAVVDYGGTIRMTGNTAAALTSSIEAETRFATGAGALDSSGFAAPLAEANAILGASDAAPSLPAVLRYEALTADWTIEGKRHRLNLALDGLGLDAHGDYRFTQDELDMRGVLTLGDSVERWNLPLDEALSAVPFHFLCRGAIGDPECRLDARRTLMGALAAEGSDRAAGLIDEYVPEEYRETARSLLDLLDVSVDTVLRQDTDQVIDEHVPEPYQGVTRALLDKLGAAPDEQH